MNINVLKNDNSSTELFTGASSVFRAPNLLFSMRRYQSVSNTARVETTPSRSLLLSWHHALWPMDGRIEKKPLRQKEIERKGAYCRPTLYVWPPVFLSAVLACLWSSGAWASSTLHMFQPSQRNETMTIHPMPGIEQSIKTSHYTLALSQNI